MFCLLVTMNRISVFDGRNVVFILEFLSEKRLIVVAYFRGDRYHTELRGGKKSRRIGGSQIGDVFDDGFSHVFFENFDKVRMRIRTERDNVVDSHGKYVGA